jgi:hypothetical protein
MLCPGFDFVEVLFFPLMVPLRFKRSESEEKEDSSQLQEKRVLHVKSSALQLGISS